jgi:hypothetical protein
MFSDIFLLLKLDRVKSQCILFPVFLHCKMTQEAPEFTKLVQIKYHEIREG